MRALVIEDDVHLSDAICTSIAELAETQQAFDGDEGLFQAMQNIFDIIILDIMLPGMNGYEVLSALRRGGISTPVLILTAKDGLDDKIKGFQLGADDYLPKPFHREELLLRLEAILRRTSSGFREHSLIFKELALDPLTRAVTIGGEAVELHGKQFDILEYLIANQNIILTREQIFDRVWGFDSETGTNVLEVYASNLRKTLKLYGYDRYIQTVRGMGYILRDRGDEHA
ncbi:response regulator transcription factor [Oscillospiraceae bacterium MB08-C2-2]|nr:response regulator transcription factor [Oscillospiraceae bacterium MB08-C2-2]